MSHIGIEYALRAVLVLPGAADVGAACGREHSGTVRGMRRDFGNADSHLPRRHFDATAIPY